MRRRNLIRLGAAVGAIICTILIVDYILWATKFELSAGLFAFVVLGGLLLLATIDPDLPSRAARSGAEFGLFGLSYKAPAAAAAAQRVDLTGEELDDDEVEVRKWLPSGYPEEDFSKVQELLHEKIEKARRCIYGPASKGDERWTLDRLRDDGLLPAREYRLASLLLDPKTGDEIAEWARSDVEVTLETGWQLATRFAAREFDRHARAQLEAAGFFVADFRQGPRHRPDFLVAVPSRHAGGAAVLVRVAARVNREAKMTVERFRKLEQAEGAGDDAAVSVSPRIVATPDHLAGGSYEELSDSIAICGLTTLIERLTEQGARTPPAVPVPNPG